MSLFFNPLLALIINLIGHRNGVGLNRDLDILTEECKKCGHTPRFVEVLASDIQAADVNLFVDWVNFTFFPSASLNVFLPNPEWCTLSHEELNRFDLILCKTREGEKIFKKINPRSLFLSFTSKDCFLDVDKDYYAPIHIVGASIQKGTRRVIQTWEKNPQFPPLQLLYHAGTYHLPPYGIQAHTHYFEEADLLKFQNVCGLHLCTSETEGFGHYMLEAMSTEAVVITTDAPPMHEFIHDARCLVPHEREEPWRLARRYFVDPAKLEMTVAELLCLKKEALKEIGKKNRERFLQNDRFFKERIKELFTPWEKGEFVWNLGITAACASNMPLPKPLFENYFHSHLTLDQCKKGGVLWLRTVDLPYFCAHILPHLEKEVVLLITDGDWSFPTDIQFDVEALLKSEKVVHIFAQNNVLSHPKVSFFPIGIDFHTMAYRGGFWGEMASPLDQQRELKEIISTLQPTHKRLQRAFVDFHWADSIRDGNFKRYLELGEDRTQIFQTVVQTGLIDHGERMPRKELWKKKGEYAFSISPHGNGLDCHRTWEDLALGCIVIVKTSPLDPLYEGLPVVIVKEWTEITPKNMKKWLKKYRHAFTDPSYREKLQSDYWLNRVALKVPPPHRV